MDTNTRTHLYAGSVPGDRVLLVGARLRAGLKRGTLARLIAHELDEHDACEAHRIRWVRFEQGNQDTLPAEAHRAAVDVLVRALEPLADGDPEAAQLVSRLHADGMLASLRGDAQRLAQQLQLAERQAREAQQALETVRGRAERALGRVAAMEAAVAADA